MTQSRRERHSQHKPRLKQLDLKEKNGRRWSPRQKAPAARFDEELA